MATDPRADDPAIDRWRQYLLLLARVQLGPARRGRPEPSDVVQQSLLDAYRNREQFRGQTEAEWGNGVGNGDILICLREPLGRNLVASIICFRRNAT